MRAPDYDDVFVVGDCTLIMNPHHGRPYPPTAQIAIQQADTIARNIKALIDKNEKTMEFKANLKGTVASLGNDRSEEHTSELQSRGHLVCRLLLEKKKKKQNKHSRHINN